MFWFFVCLFVCSFWGVVSLKGVRYTVATVVVVVLVLVAEAVAMVMVLVSCGSDAAE